MAKTKQPLVVGRWSEDGVFEALPEQPDAQITDMAKMIAWTKAAFKEEPGTYDLVRKVPGQLIVSQQTEFTFEFKQPEGAGAQA